MRLGGGVSDGEEIKSHPFFASVDWAALQRKAVDAPWRPVVRGVRDLRNIDPVFTTLAIADSVDDTGIARTSSDAPAFENFTYVSAEFVGPAPAPSRT